MQRVNNYNFYMLGHIVHRMTSFQDNEAVKIKDIYVDLMSARNWLNSAINGQLGCDLNVCQPAAWKVLDAIAKILPQGSPQPKIDFDKELDYWGDGLYSIAHAVREFETVFAAEMQSADTYYVSPKGIYSTDKLIDSAENMFPQQIRTHLSNQAITDWKQAGRCLALECPTAAGFHILRAAEDVLRDYYQAVTGTQPKKKLRSWAAYIKRLEQAGAEKKVLGILDQIRDLHRNPVFHPEDNLTTDETVTLLGIAQSAIVAMVLDMKDRKSGSLPLAAVGP